MTEDQIERRVKRLFDVLDRALMRGDIAQLQYEDMVHDLCAWANWQYQNQKEEV